MKICPKCNEPKSTDDFYDSKNTKDGLFSWCKECHAIACKRNRLSAKQGYRYCIRCSETKLLSSFTSSKGRLCETCRPVSKKQRDEKTLEFHRQQRLEAIRLLGGRCVSCGNIDFRVLQIDHINGGGSKERASKPFRWIEKQIIAGNTESYQCLCANCNWIKKYEAGEVCGYLLNN